MICISCKFIPLKLLTFRIDHAKLLDVLMSLPVSHAILPRVMCFATLCLASHAIRSYIESSGYASGPIRRRLFMDYIIKHIIYLFSGHYMFIETSSPRRAGDVARLISPAFNPVSSSGRCISFWYTMYGQTIDKFRVIVTAQGMGRYSQTCFNGNLY